MSMAKGQRSGFEDRLSRIKKGGANTMGEVHLGPREEVRANQAAKSKPSNTVRLKRKNTRKKEIGRNTGLSLIILAFIFGGLSMFVGQAAAFHFFEDGGLVPLDLSGTPVAEYLPFAAYAIGGTLGLLFCWTFRLTSLLRLVAMVGGLFVMVEYHTEMVKALPSIYVSFFSEDYVEGVFLNTQA